MDKVDPSIFDADYFLHGKESGKSLYENYRWLPELTLPMCRAIARACNIDEDDTILDFGCSRGYVVRAFRELGYRARGFDVSEWAIDHCDPLVKHYVHLADLNFLKSVAKQFDWVIAKDVLEHIPDPDLSEILKNLFRYARKGVFVVVPLSPEDGAPYVVPEYEKDITHVQRLTLGGWSKKLQHAGFCVSSCYRVPGVKDNYSQFEQGNGFLFCKRETPL